ncbi:MAG: hypothetical protein NT130_02205 [Candidatus Micrarchaeota archaeon]|nr:hypothetical protein [Candidatus Micrarchaeota archaeon]
MRGQTALEYLITYGWAVVAISVIMVLLFYMNVFNPSAWMPVSNEAVGLSVFGVTDFSVNGSGWIVLYLVNNAQASVNLTDIRIQGSSLVSPNPPLPRLLSPGANLTISGISIIVGNKGDAFYSDTIAFNYSIVGGANHTDSGILRGKID